MNADTRQAALADFKAQTHECQHPGSRTLTTHTHCARHRPLGEWAIAEQVRDERRREEQEGGDA